MDKIMSKIKELWQKSPHLVFVGVLGLAALLVIIITLIGRAQSANNPPVSQPVQQTVPQATYQPTQQQQPVQQPQQQQSQPTNQNVVSWQGIYPQIAGPVQLTTFTGTSLAGTDYSGGQPSLLIQASKEANSYGGNSASVVFPLGGRYKSVSFDLAQPVNMGNLNGYAYGTTLTVDVDGKKAVQEITKDDLVSKDIPVSLDLTGKSQLVIKLSTFGKKVTDNNGFTNITDESGPFFPVVLGHLYFTVVKG